MKIFSSELGYNYGTYTFGYTTYCQKEPNDQLGHIYEKGFLPYTGSSNAQDIFYMARNIRIQLEGWAQNSENRRVYSKFADLSSHTLPIEGFDTNDPQFRQFCLNYFAQRHGERVMPKERLDFILSSGLITHIVEYKKQDELVGYVFLIEDEHINHYIFSFYDLSHLYQSLGLWLMIDCVISAQKRGKLYSYLGTSYGEKGLYKTNFDQLEFWDGHGWVADRDALRQRCRTDNERIVQLTDQWKDSLEQRFQ